MYTLMHQLVQEIISREEMIRIDDYAVGIFLERNALTERN